MARYARWRAPRIVLSLRPAPSTPRDAASGSGCAVTSTRARRREPGDHLPRAYLQVGCPAWVRARVQGRAGQPSGAARRAARSGEHRSRRGHAPRWPSALVSSRFDGARWRYEATHVSVPLLAPRRCRYVRRRNRALRRLLAHLAVAVVPSCRGRRLRSCWAFSPWLARGRRSYAPAAPRVCSPAWRGVRSASGASLSLLSPPARR
jgi:hypothetical protein